MHRITTVLAATLTSVLAPAVITAQTPKPVNIVVFTADDHGYRDSTVFGSTQVRTPHMERIAKQGARFTHTFVASPSCAPSRAAILTGLMPAKNGAEANHSAPRETITTLPAFMRRLGYVVAAFGKVAHYKMANRFSFTHADDKHDKDTVAAFLKTRERSKPLCLFVGTHKPHVPWPENDGYDPAKLKPPQDAVDTPPTREYLAKYYTSVTQMDQEMGDIFDLIRAELGEDTLFIYVSDHGAQWPFGKWNLYDSGIRVPMLAVWPGRLAPGSTIDAMISSVDLLPTLVEIGGGVPSKDIDGRSFAKVLRGQTKTHRDEIFATHTSDGRFNVYPCRCLRTRDFAYILNLHPDWAHTTHIDMAKPRDGLGYWLSWKNAAKNDPVAAALVKRYHQRPREELYDIAADPWQLKNLAGDPRHADRLKQMRGRLAEWMKEQGDEGRVLIQPRPLSDPASWQQPIKQPVKPAPKSAVKVQEFDDHILIETDTLEAKVRKKGYVSGIAAGSLLDKKTGARDAGFGLHIMDFLLAPGWRDDGYTRDRKVHGDLPKQYVEGPQICTQAKQLTPEIIRGKDFVAVRMAFTFTNPGKGYKAGSTWTQTLVFQPGLRYIFSSEEIESVNDVDNVLYRIDMPGHVRHKAGDTFNQVYLSYHDGLIPGAAFTDNFAPDDKFLYQRRPGKVPERFIRAYQVKMGGKPGPWLAGMTLNPDDVVEAWCHQRGYICFIQELHGRPIRAGATFGAAYIVGWFDDLAAMHARYDRHKGASRIEVSDKGFQLK